MEHSKWNVFLIEDDEDDYVLTRTLLSEASAGHFQLTWFRSASSGLAALETQLPDIFLVDYHLGAENGLDFIRQAKAQGCQAPAILLTGQGSYEVDVEAMQTGAVDYLNKGEINARLLERSIRYAIEQSTTEEALRCANERLAQANEDLERRVQERTLELEALNRQLQAEIVKQQSVEQALRDRESLLAQVLKVLPVGVWIIDEKGTTILSNPAGEMIWEGAQPAGIEDYQGKKGWWKHTQEPIRAEEWSAVRAITRGETVINEEIEIECINGARKTILGSAIPLRQGGGPVRGAILVNQEITDRVMAEEQIRRQASRAEALLKIAQIMAEAGLDLEKVFNVVVQSIVDLIGDTCALALVAEDGDWLTIVAQGQRGTESIPTSEEDLLPARIRLGEGMLGLAAQIGETLPQNDTSREGLLKETRRQPEGENSRFQTHSLLAVPLKVNGRVIGAIQVSRAVPHQPYSPDDRIFLEHLANRAALAIANAELYQKAQRELTERELAQAAQHRSEILFEHLFDSAPDPIVLLDGAGRILKVNRQMTARFGYLQDELAGQAVEVLVPESRRSLHVEHRRQYMARPETRLMGFGLDVYARCKDGSEFPADITLSYLEREEGSLIICVVHDISLRKRAEDALRKSEARFRAIFEESALGILLLNLEGRILACNATLKEMVEYSGSELREMKLWDLSYPPRAGLNSELYKELIAGQRTEYRIEIRYRQQGGGLIWVRQTVSMVRDDQGLPLFAIGMIEDISERKQIEAELSEVQRRLIDNTEAERLYLAQELHDGPMQDLYGLVYQLASLYNDPMGTEIRSGLESIDQSLKEVVIELRAIAGELRPPTLAPFGLEKAIRDHAERFHAAHPELQLHLELMPDGKVLAERVRLALFRIYQQSLTNVVRHAFASQVNVRLLLGDEEVVLEVQDDGKGFVLPERWITLARGGHMGIIGSIERAEAVGGKLQVITSPGQGTLVRVTIPRPQAEDQPLEESWPGNHLE